METRIMRSNMEEIEMRVIIMSSLKKRFVILLATIVASLTAVYLFNNYLHHTFGSSNGRSTFSFLRRYEISSLNVSSQLNAEMAIQLVTSSPPILKQKIILGWTHSFTQWNWLRDIGLDTCENKGCMFTTNRSLLHEALAVVFCCGAVEWNDVPTWRENWQLYVLLIFESAQNTFVNYASLRDKRARNFFNWTQTYRRDSTVYRPYGMFKQVERFEANETAMLNKTKTVAQFVSNCHTWSRREVVVSELQKHIEVDLYGACGVKKCQCESELWCRQCLDVLNSYRFYLAFENSVCKDYITEKFFDRLLLPIVPIVLYGSNYEPIAPPHSYIALDAFPSVVELAAYLKYLAQNESAYQEYFAWRTEYVIVSFRKHNSAFCPLCDKLLEHNSTRHSSYEDVYSWWVTEGNCANRYGETYVNQLGVSRQTKPAAANSTSIPRN